MNKKIESLKDYQLSNTIDFDYLEIAEKLNKKEKINKDDVIKKSYSHSLFTPILSYIIDYINDNGEKPGIVGKSIIDNIEVIYIILNHKIYDLFFKREKGFLFDEANKIDYDLQIEKENYLIPKMQYEEKELNEEALNQIASDFFGKEKMTQNIKDLFEFKKREIISSFKLGYSIQERIMNTLISKCGGNIIELPNLIFFKVNKSKKNYYEVDRIVTVNNSIEIDKFFIYAKAEFRKKKCKDKEYEIKYADIKNGEKLKLMKDACIFIEVKTSMNYLMIKDINEKENENDYDYSHVPSSINSSNSKNITKKNIFQKMYYNMKTFKDLFENLNMKFKDIILIIIIDSYFPKNFFDNAKIFAESLGIKEIDFNFDLYFIHIDSGIIYTHELTEMEKISKNLTESKIQLNLLKSESEAKANTIKTLENNIENLKSESANTIKALENNIENLKSESEAKANTIKTLQNNIENLKTESVTKANAVKSLEDNIRLINQKFIELDRKNKLRKIHKKIMKDSDLSEYIEKNVVSGKNVFKCEIKNKVKENSTQNVSILDYKTFCRLYYKNEYIELIDDVKIKHFKNLDKYISENKKIDNLILIVDFVFILSLKEIMEKYFKDKNLIINEATNNFFKLSFRNVSDQAQKLFIMKPKFPNCKLLNLNKIPNMNNFITYYFDIKEKNDLNNIDRIKNFLLYDPLTNKNNLYLDIFKTNSKSDTNSVVFLIIDPSIEAEDLKLEFYKSLYKYIALLYQTYYFDIKDDFFKNLFSYFFSNGIYDVFSIFPNYKIVKETNSKVLLKEDISKSLIIKNREKNIIETKFKVIEFDSNQNFIINTNFIKDKNINCIIESIPFKKNIKINILIEESCNILYKYLQYIYKNADFVLLNNFINDNEINNLKKLISTDNKNELNTNLISYINENAGKKFDLIILENEFDTCSLFYKKDALISIKDSLKEKGLFIIHLIADNIYSKNNIYKNLSSIFKNVRILNADALYELNNVLMCSNN